MASLLPLKQIKPGDIASEDYCVFGGTFDPIHQGHVSVIKQLTRHFRHILVAPTEKNPWKNEQPPALSLRLEMIELVFSDENIDTEQMGVELVPFPYVFSRDLVDYLRRVRPGNPWWAVGEDSAESVSRWRNWDTAAVTTIVVPELVDIHAVQVRTGEADLHPALEAFARKHQLYGR